jgi:parallel beta-helix repeat protein
MKKVNSLLICVLTSLVLAACGPSQADQEATATQIATNIFATQTAAVPTSTPTATATPTPTVTSTPTPTPGPVTVRLSPDGSGDYPSLEAAVDAVTAESTLILAPGTYRLMESLDIRQSLRLVGTGMDQTEIVSEAEGYVVRFSGDGPFTVEDLTFRHEGEAMADVVVVEGGEVDFARCRFTGAVLVKGEGARGSLHLTRSTTGLVQDCIAEGNKGIGILVEDRAQITLVGTICSDNEVAGITIGGQAQPTLEENICSDNEIGIAYVDDAGGVARQNQFTGNELGVFVIDQAQPTLEENVCSDNEMGGIGYMDSAGGVARRNQVERNGFSDIDVFGQAHPTLEQNVCSGGFFSGGISVEDTASPTLVNNDCDVR